MPTLSAHRARADEARRIVRHALSRWAGERSVAGLTEERARARRGEAETLLALCHEMDARPSPLHLFLFQAAARLAPGSREERVPLFQIFLYVDAAQPSNVDHRPWTAAGDLQAIATAAEVSPEVLLRTRRLLSRIEHTVGRRVDMEQLATFAAAQVSLAQAPATDDVRAELTQLLDWTLGPAAEASRRRRAE
ncbi:hypothetical protein STVA_41280 [Allostella vacuolata]|nr:hypothetical protein STVA_41280 [Stella vacuolata]